MREMPPSSPSRGYENYRNLEIVEFLAADRKRYLRWDQFRRNVFADELGWNIPPQPANALAYSDPFDEHAQLFSAEDGADLVGIIRCVKVSDGFPHQKLFQHHLRELGPDMRVSMLGTVNALAVTPYRRRRLFVDTSDGQLGTASTLLLGRGMRSLGRSGVAVVLATVLSAVSARVFIRAGFRLLDAPFVSEDDPRFVLANVGIVLGPERDGAAPTLTFDLPALTTEQYFCRRHAAILSQGRLEEIFSAPR